MELERAEAGGRNSSERLALRVVREENYVDLGFELRLSYVSPLA